MKETNADNNKNCNAITNSTPYISKIDNGVFLTQKTSNNNYDLSYFLHGKIHKNSEILNSYTNNLSNTISNYNIQKNIINLSENEHKENLSKAIVSSDADALTTKGINTRKHNT
ncbi:hypothetical protein COBT_004178, partial [Conglomerata obtusa]